MDNVLPVRNRAGRRRDATVRRRAQERRTGLLQDTQEQVVIEETLLEAEETMEKAVVVAKEDFAAIRTGRAHPAMFNKIVADYYGALTPINQLASFSVPEPRMAVVTPFDKSALRNIEQAIRDSDLGVNPSNDGNIIRVTFPELTEERRRDYIKVAKTKGEDAKVSIRSVRRKAKDAIDKLVKDGEVGEDEGRRAEKELDDTTAKYVAQVDELLKHKEAELLEV
jgi:ribosome recycling factor